MSEPKAHELVPQVIVKEVAPVGSIQAKNLHKEMAKNLVKREWVAAAELAANVAEVNYEGFARRTASFGVELDREGNVKRSTEGDNNSEVKLAERVGKVENVAKKFFEVGFDKLDPTSEQDVLINNVINQAKRIPLLSTRVEQAIREGKSRDFAIRMIKDPTYSAELKNFLNDHLAGDFSNLVIEKWEELKVAEDEEEIVKQELEVIEAQVNNAKSRLNSFSRDNNGNASEGAINARRMDDLNSAENNPARRRQEIASIQSDLTAQETLVKTLEGNQNQAFLASMKNVDQDPQLLAAQTDAGIAFRKIQQYKASIAAREAGATNAQTKLNELEPQFAALEEKINQLKASKINIPSGNDSPLTSSSEELNNARGKLVEMKQRRDLLMGQEEEMRVLQADQEAAENAVKNLEAEKRAVLERQQEKTRDKQKVQREYNAAKEVRLSEERNFTERIENSFGAASNAIIKRQIEQGNEAYGEELEDMRKLSGSLHEDAIRVTLMNTWLGPERTRRMDGMPGKRKSETVRPFDKSKILQDYGTLLREGDNALIRSILKRTINPDTGALRRQFTDEEIDDIYDKNPDLIEKMRPEATKQLLARKAMVGGFTPEDTYTLSSTAWGQQAIENAYLQNETFRNAIKNNFGEGALQRHGFFQRFGQEMAKHPFWWTLCLGIPAIFGTLGTEPERDTLDKQR